MTPYIVLLRGINVGGHKKVAMSDLRRILEDLGFEDVQSLIQTGNLVFRGNTRTAASLERLLEVEAEKDLDLRTAFFVRTAKEWRKVIDHNPFPEAAESDPGHLIVMFLKEALHANAVKALQRAVEGPEIIRVDGRQLYIVYPAGIGRSRLTNKLIEDKLGTRGTGRNWNTVVKLAAMAGPSGD